MKKVIIFIIVVALVLMLTPGLLYAKPGIGRIQTEWELTLDYGILWEHHMTIDSLDPSTGDFTGTGYFIENTGYTWDVTGNISKSDITFTIVYTGINAGYWMTVDGILADDGSSFAGTGWNNSQSGDFTGEATYKNHGEVVKDADDKSETAKSKDGKPAVSK